MSSSRDGDHLSSYYSFSQINKNNSNLIGKSRDKGSRLGIESVPKFSSDNSNNSSSKTL